MYDQLEILRLKSAVQFIQQPSFKYPPPSTCKAKFTSFQIGVPHKRLDNSRSHPARIYFPPSALGCMVH